MSLDTRTGFFGDIEPLRFDPEAETDLRSATTTRCGT